MAKKNTNSMDETAITTPAAPAKRRAPAQRKRTAAAPAEVATPRRGRADNASDASATAERGGDGHNSNSDYQPSHEEIAQAAYFRHLNRGGEGGDEFNDWLEAERELRERRR